jgi:hypothetical protein
MLIVVAKMRNRWLTSWPPKVADGRFAPKKGSNQSSEDMTAGHPILLR